MPHQPCGGTLVVFFSFLRLNLFIFPQLNTKNNKITLTDTQT